MDSEIKSILKLMAILIKPEKQNNRKDETFVLDMQLLANLDQLKKQLTDIKSSSTNASLIQLCCTEDTAIQWKFVNIALCLLQDLNDAFNLAMEKYNQHSKENLFEGRKVDIDSSAPPLAPNVLGLSEEKIVSTILQFIVCLGISPLLQPGVGIPLQKRSGFARFVQTSSTNGEDREQRLYMCAKTLVTCYQQPSIGSLIICSHLGDLIAALAQVAYAVPRKVISSDSKSGSAAEISHRNMSPAEVVNAVLEQQMKATKITSNECIPNKSKLTDDEKRFCKQELHQLMEKVYPALVVRELMILQTNIPGCSKVPVWLRKLCNYTLNRKLMRPFGVQYILRGMLEGTTTSDMHSAENWKKCDSAAKLIATCPKDITIEEYYKTISPQVLELLHFKDRKVACQFLRVATSTIIAMVNLNPEEAKRFLLHPLLKPLFSCLPGGIQNEIDEKTFSLCIEDVHKVFFVPSESNSVLIHNLKPVISVLFDLHCHIFESVSPLKQVCQEMLLGFLKSYCNSEAVDFLQFFSFQKVFSNDESEDLHSLSSKLTFIIGDNGGVRVVHNTEQKSLTFETRANVLVHLLKQLKYGETSVQFFLSLLQQMTEVIDSQVKQNINPSFNGHDAEQPLLEIENRVQHEVDKIADNLMLLQLIALLCEHLPPSCFTNTQHILQFARVTLERGVYVLQHTNEEEFGLFESETITMAMGLLTAVLSGASKVLDADRKILAEMLPLLEQLSHEHPDNTVQEMASDLRIAIATHGHVLSDTLKQAENCRKEASNKSKVGLKEQFKEPLRSSSHKKPLIEEISLDTSSQSVHLEDAAMNVRTATTHSTSENSDATSDLVKQALNEIKTKNSDKMTDDSLLHQAFEELMDPLIPVRGHALITLRKLLQEKHPSAIAKKDVLFKIFQENLRHHDTYIYLAAIQGLAILADQFSEEILILLVEQLASPSLQHKKDSSEIKLKVGEVLVKAFRNMGQMMPKYKDVLLNCMLNGAKDADYLVRASSISNLADISKLLLFSLGSCVHQLFACVSTLLKSDPEAEVRKAAAMFTTSLLQGVGQDALKVLDSVLKDLYHLLKLTLVTEKDEGVLLHVHLALDELDSIMRKFLFPQQTFSKKISVLTPP